MIYSAFDPATAYLVAGFLYVVMPLAAWFVMGNGRTQAASVWCLGSMLLGVATLLLALRGNWPGWLGFGVLNAIFYAGNLLHVMALRQELGQSAGWRVAVLIGLVLLSVQEYLRLQMDSPSWRFAWVLLSLGFLLGWTGWLAWQLYLKEGSQSARWLAWVYAFGAIAFLLRVVRVMLGLTAPLPVSMNWDSVMTAISLFAMAVFGSVAILGLYLERSTRQHVADEVTMRSQQTSQLLGQQIANLDRQRSMGELAGAMAHEMAQPLTAVSVELGFLRHELRAANDPRQSQVEKIMVHAERASHVLKGIRNFIRPAEPDFKPVNLLTVVHDVLQLLPANERNEAVEIQVHTDVLTPMVMGDSVQLSQGKPAHIGVRVLAADERLQVVVEDDGPGFSAELLGGTDMAFTSTKKDGMGIGLAISRRIAEQHGGALLWRNREHDGGAQVILDLPVWMVSKGGK
jgi:signal transduction histidine kinase